MFGVVLVATGLGVCFGTLTGLVPGIHTNLVATLFPVLFGSFVSGVGSAVFLVSLGVTHTVTSILPNVYLGVCEGDDVVNVLPAHRLVGAGRGGDAVLANVFGGVVAASLGALYFTLAAFVVSSVYPFVERWLVFLLGGVMVYLLFRDSRWYASGCVLVLSGGLGYVVLGSSLEHALFPLLSGLFGVPLLLFSDGGVVGEEECCEGIPVRCGRTGLVGTCLGLLTSFLPGVGSGVAASMGARSVSGEATSYLGLTGALDTADFYLSLAALWVVEKARNGVVVVLDRVVRDVSFGVLVCVGVVAVGCGGIVTLWLQPRFSAVFSVVPYQALMRGIVALLFGLTVVLSGVRGVSVFVVASFLGCYTHRLGVSKIVMMACIVVPVLVFSLW